MADSAVVVTAGTGTNIDTRTEATNGNHRQVVVLGDPATNAGVAPVDATAGLKVDLGADNDVTVAGVSTAAKQDTIIGHLDGVEGILTTIDADTGTIATEVAGLLTDTELRATPVPVSGTVTANLSATDNAVLDAIEVDTTTIAGAISGTEMQVDVLTMPSVTVTATNLDVRDLVAASDSVTVHGDVGVVDQLDLTNTNPLAVAIVDGDGTQITAFGGGTQYTEDAASAANPVGTVPILVRKDAPASEVTTDGDNVAQRGTTYGAAYVTLLDTGGSPVSVGGGTQYTEDSAAAANPVGTALIGVRADTLTGVTTTDGDNVAARMTDKGELYVKHVDAIPVTDNGGALTVDGTVAVTSAGITTIAGAVSGTEMQVDVLTMPTVTVTATNLDVQSGGADLATTTQAGAIQTAVELLDDAVYTDDTSTHATGTSKGLGIMAAATPTDSAVAANDIGMVAMTTDRKLHVAVMDALPAGTAAIGKLAANSGVDIGDVDILSIAAGDNNIGNVDIASIAAGDNNIGNVDIVTMPTVTVNSHAVTNAGTFATQVDGSALTALQLIDDTVFADDAGVTLGTSKGNVVAGVAVNTDGTDPTAVSAEGDAAALRTDMNRLLIVNQTHPRFWHVSADYGSAQTNASVKAAPGASLSLYVTDIQVSNGATAGNVTLLDGSGGTVLYELYPAINGGAVLSLRSPIKLTANTALCITSTSCTTHSVFVSGYIAA